MSQNWPWLGATTRYLCGAMLAALAAGGPVNAQTVYKSVDAEGKVTYSEEPPPGAVTSETLEMIPGGVPPMTEAERAVSQQQFIDAQRERDALARERSDLEAQREALARQKKELDEAKEASSLQGATYSGPYWGYPPPHWGRPPHHGGRPDWGQRPHPPQQRPVPTPGGRLSTMPARP